MELGTEKLKEIYKRYRGLFFASFAAGLAAYGMMLTNVLNNHDSVYNLPSGFGAGVTSGRWFLELLGRLVEDWWGGNYVLPLYNGLFALFYISLAYCLIVSLLRLRSRPLAVLLGCLFTVFPSVAGSFLYIFTAQYYALSVLLAVAGAWLADRRKWGFLPGAVCLALSMGLYQAYLPLASALLLLCLLRRCFLGGEGEVRPVVAAAFRYLAALLLGLALYFIATAVSLRLCHVTLTAYNGINEMGRLSLAELPGLLLQAYKDVLLLPVYPVYGVAMSKVIRLAVLLCHVLSAALFVYLLLRARIKGLFRLGACLALLLLPVAMDLIVLMCRPPISDMMSYGLVCLFFLPAVLLELASSEAVSFSKLPPRNSRSIAAGLLAAALFLAGLNYIWQDNSNYTALFYTNQQTVQYLNSMLTRIRSLDGYSQDRKLAIIGDSIADRSFYNYIGENTGAHLRGNFIYYTNSYSWKSWLQYYLGCAQPLAGPEETEALAKTDRVRAMPCYPDSGSLCLIGDTIVLKLADVS